MGAAGDGGRSKGGPSPAEMLHKGETKKTLSSVSSKLSAPKLAKGAIQDARKEKVGSFSAGLSKDKILESQARSAASQWPLHVHTLCA